MKGKLKMNLNLLSGALAIGCFVTQIAKTIVDSKKRDEDLRAMVNEAVEQKMNPET